MDKAESPYMTTKEVAEFTRHSPRYWQEQVRLGNVPSAKRYKKRILFIRQEFILWWSEQLKESKKCRKISSSNKNRDAGRRIVSPATEHSTQTFAHASNARPQYRYNMMKDQWQLIRSESLRDYSILQVREDWYRFHPTGAESGFVVCDSLDWVLIIPITVDGDVVFVRQFRHGLRDVVLEIPGGVMEPGETPATTAARELVEETGYVPESVRIFGPLLPNPALNTARCHIAVATNCELRGEPSPDPFELIETELRPLADVESLISSGELSHALCIAAFAVSGVHLR